MANEKSLRSYRDFDAYNREVASDDTVRRDQSGDPLAELARIMGQDENYADLLKSVARTRGDGPAPDDGAGGARPPAEPHDGRSADDISAWEDLEAELQSFMNSGEGARPKAETARPAVAAEPEAHMFDDALDEEEQGMPAARASVQYTDRPAVETQGLRGSYTTSSEIDMSRASIDELERLLAEQTAAQARYQQAEATPSYPSRGYQQQSYQPEAYQQQAQPEPAYPPQDDRPSAYQDQAGRQGTDRAAASRHDARYVAAYDDEDQAYGQGDAGGRSPAGAGFSHGATAAAAAGGLAAGAAIAGWRHQAVPVASARTAAPPADDGYAEPYPASEGYLPAAERSASDPVYVQDGHMPQHDPAMFEEAPPRRRRAGATAILAVVGLAVVGGGAVFGYRALTGRAGGSGEPRVVHANATPVRVPVQQEQDAKPVVDRTAGGDRIVPREERPVSLREQAAQVQAPPAPAAPRVIPLSPASGGAAGQDQIPVRSVQTMAIPAANAAPAAALRPSTSEGMMPQVTAPVPGGGEEPRRVRTVAVGPNGQLLAPAQRPAPGGLPLSANPAAPAATVAQGEPRATPSDAAPPALAAADSRAVPMPVPRPAARPAHPAEGNEQARTASRPAGGPVDLAPQRTASLQQPSAAAAAAPAAGSGSSFVQISSHQSESEARGAFLSAQRRYPQLQGYSANIRAAELPGRGTWYRLRVGPFSRTEAQTFCERLKSAGGSCVLN